MASLTLYAGNTATCYKSDGNYDVAEGATTSDSVSNNAALAIRDNGSGTYYVDRGFMYFDTSSIPNDATVTSAILRLYATAKSGTKTLNVGKSTSTNTTYTTSDFNDQGASVGGEGVGDIETSAWNEYSISTPAEVVSLTGNTQISLSVAYGFGANTNVTFSGSNDVTYKPQLVVTYSVPGGFFAFM